MHHYLTEIRRFPNGLCTISDHLSSTATILFWSVYGYA